jgi:hypothetical protein
LSVLFCEIHDFKDLSKSPDLMIHSLQEIPAVPIKFL